MHASALGENAVERYALFLTSLDNSTTREERRKTLRRAEQHDLDMIRVRAGHYGKISMLLLPLCVLLIRCLPRRRPSLA